MSTNYLDHLLFILKRTNSIIGGEPVSPAHIKDMDDAIYFIRVDLIFINAKKQGIRVMYEERDALINQIRYINNVS